MIKRARRIAIAPDADIPVAQIEDLIGLKIQASVNDPTRCPRDWADIRMMLETAGENRDAVDWELVAQYLDIFRLSAKLPELKGYYRGQT